MSLDFVFAKSAEDVSSSKIMFAMDEPLHTLMFSFATPKKSFPAIFRMEDFYADNKFDFASLQRLEGELKIITQKKGGEVLEGFVGFISDAVKRGGSVYLLAD